MEQSELATLYEQYGYFVHQRCLLILRKPEDADDACQEVFLRVQRYFDGRRDGSILAWLYTIALRCCLDLARRRSREEPTDAEALARADTRSVSADPDQRAALGAALRLLDEKACAIGVLYYLDGYTQEEVAVRTGYSRRTIGTKLRAFLRTSRVQEFVARILKREFLEVMPEFYAGDATAQENNEPPRVGLAAMMANERGALARVTFTKIEARSVLVDGDREATGWSFEMAPQDGRRSSLDEVAYRVWRDGKIISERYFYEPAQRKPR